LVSVYSLSKASRLTKTEQFGAARHADHRENGAVFQVLVKRKRQGIARLGVVVNKKGTPRAVDRNYVKRLIREQFRIRKRDLVDMDIVIRVHGVVSKSHSRQARMELSDLLSKVSRWAA